ncbi:hypothetical protein GCM10009837_51330 [Streptomyces durmitorensis]|uniref:DUF308 domain-containing protein n=1 Tax=Streptomyces durmitorensis TaxID=319947 RepID=A0ABY4Q1G6_9ACTN|nr:hypothetical protein [Streptomyces durmitorensis]UQT59031.1 hypothetical protein M4V62_30460 [Streptomyces durmitorensis]
MAEQDRIEPDGDESREPEKRQEPSEGLPLDEDAAWQAIVAGYGQEPADPPGAKPFKSIEDLALLEPETNGTPDAAAKDATAPDDPDDSGSKKTLGGSVSFAPGVGGPRDYDAPEASDDDLGEDDEGHFVPPEPPPLPAADVTAKFAWLAVLGGPLLLLLAVLLGWQMTWWLTTLSIGGFLGGFGTLVSRMKGDDEEDEDPGRGAVV